MSTTCLPASAALDGPLPVAPRHSLLSIPGVVRDAPGERWVGGASFVSYLTDEPSFFLADMAGTTRAKGSGTGHSLPNWGSFVIYVPITCSTYSIDDPDDFQMRAERVLEAVESFAVERALARGIAGSSNPFLADVNADVLDAGAKSPQEALGWLENAIGETGRQGMIHATPAVASRWFEDPQTDDSPVLLTANGNPVASGGGYIGATPSGQSAAGDGQSWVFATGPVQVRHSEVITHENFSEAMDRATNEVTMRAERYELVSWDQELQAAILVDWTA